MRFDHDPHCVHCLAGCDHDHEPDDLMVQVGLQMPVVPGSRMRHGGVLHDPETGLSLASNKWLNLRCRFCSTEAMTPSEVIPDWWPAELDTDGVRLGVCASCHADIERGFRPGHNPHRRRRAGRHG